MACVGVVLDGIYQDEKSVCTFLEVVGLNRVSRMCNPPRFAVGICPLLYNMFTFVACLCVE
jgi:hypothetical protein